MAGKLSAGKIGILVAGDMPEQYLGELEAREVEPMEIMFRFKNGRREPFRIPCRPPNAVESILLINRALSEGKVEFGFQPKGSPLVTGDGT